MNIIDFHIHPFLSKEDFLCFYPEVFEAPDLNMLLSDMEKAGIDTFCGSVISQKTNDYSKIRTDNDKALEIWKILGSRYIPGIHVHPDFVEESVSEIKRTASLGVKLIGELVPYHHGWSDYSSDSFGEILNAAEQYGMTVSLHTMSLAEMRMMAKQHKDISFVFAHPGEKERLSEHISVMKDCENVYLDLSGGGLHRFGMLKKLCHEVGADRIIFGTDYPLMNPKMYVNAVLGEHISDREKEQILHKNAERLLNL